MAGTARRLHNIIIRRLRFCSKAGSLAAPHIGEERRPTLPAVSTAPARDLPGIVVSRPSAPSPFRVVARLSRPQARRPRPLAAWPRGGRRGRKPGASPVRADCLGLGQSSRPAVPVRVAPPCCAPRPALGAGLVRSRCPSAGWAPGAHRPRTVGRLRRVAGRGRRQGNEGGPFGVGGGGGVGPGRGREGARLGPRPPREASAGTRRSASNSSPGSRRNGGWSPAWRDGASGP